MPPGLSRRCWSSAWPWPGRFTAFRASCRVPLRVPPILLKRHEFSGAAWPVLSTGQYPPGRRDVAPDKFSWEPSLILHSSVED
ncbi:hypothetical protein Pden_4718 (plasmid) [Paracoccus denitrificans PD1222]|uniref:Uncharacterized protein n=1 Tax=Paracoccus denitrificans (strain Pd 1222) TaxID=318586 RepID=A1BB85_PARDP|nr:hypothetical protein Pden_4718 [Paracoccus denitrificans PD1222]